MVSLPLSTYSLSASQIANAVKESRPEVGSSRNISLGSGHEFIADGDSFAFTTRDASLLGIPNHRVLYFTQSKD